MIAKKSRRLKKEKQTIEKGSRRLKVRRKKKFEPTISKCCNCMFCTTLRNNKMKKAPKKNSIERGQGLVVSTKILRSEKFSEKVRKL
jgi:hypothetical protein